MIKIKGAWYVKSLPESVVVEFEDGRMATFYHSPVKKITEADCTPYRGLHPTVGDNNPAVPDYMLPLYGLEVVKQHGGSRPGAGRPPLPEGEVRKARSVKFSDAEWEAVKEMATMAGISTSEFIRMRALESTDEWLLEQIRQVANDQTDFDIGFNNLFRFMAKNPDSATTRGFIEYHRVEMNDPKTPKGDADFTYLIGKEFIAEHWVAAEDLDK